MLASSELYFELKKKISLNVSTEHPIKSLKCFPGTRNSREAVPFKAHNPHAQVLYSRVPTTQAIYQLIHVNITILKKRTCVRVCVCVCVKILFQEELGIPPPHNIHANPHPPPGGEGVGGAASL